MAVGRLPAAINELERALELDPQELAAAQLLAEAYISVDRSGDAARLQELVEEMGGRIILEYEFGRIIGVRSLEIPAGSWGLGEEIELGLEWTVVRPAAGEFKPDLYLSGGTSRLLIKPPRGGWPRSTTVPAGRAPRYPTEHRRGRRESPRTWARSFFQVSRVPLPMDSGDYSGPVPRG